MNFYAYLVELLNAHGINDMSCISLSDCRVINPRKLEACGFGNGEHLNVCIMAIPYYVGGKSNISEYAKARDYHVFFDGVMNDILPHLNEKYHGYKFCAFADNSPIDERDAGARAGLGVIGDNGLLITKKYSSYVFLGEIITNYPIEVSVNCDIEHCMGCGKCRSACPKNEIGMCLSSLTQKKGVLDEHEISAIKGHGSAWGCDLCQECCPYTLSAIREGTIYTSIDFFKNSRTEFLGLSDVQGMSDDEFNLRAYSWRKRETIIRNLKILEEENK